MINTNNENQNDSKHSDHHEKWKSPDIIDAKNRHAHLTNTNFYSERSNYNAPLKHHYCKNGTLEEIHFDSNRDISPYRIENFLEMLHQFGISDTAIKRKLITSPMAHPIYKHEISSESHHDSSHIIRNVSYIFFMLYIEKG